MTTVKLHKKRLATGDKVFNAFNYLIFSIFMLLCIIPFYYIIINVISDNQLVVRGEILFWPKGIHFDNFKKVFALDGMLSAFGVSVARTVLGTALTLFCNSLLGYCMSRQEMWHRRVWYLLIVATMYFGAGLIPRFLMYRDLHLINSFLVYIIPGMVSVYNMILFKTFVESLPPSLEESAELDGAGYMTRYFRIILPLCKPILATLLIFTSVGQWNSFMDTVYYVTDPRLYTLQFRLNQYLNENNNLAQLIKEMGNEGSEMAADMSAQMTTTSLKMTVTLVTMLPVLCIYPFFQKYFVGGIMVGAVKG